MGIVYRSADLAEADREEFTRAAFLEQSWPTTVALDEPTADDAVIEVFSYGRASIFRAQMGGMRLVRSMEQVRSSPADVLAVAVQDGKGVAVEVNSETDFVGKNEEFQSMVRGIADAALGVNSVEDLAAAQLNGKPVAMLAIQTSTGANALSTADGVRARMPACEGNPSAGSRARVRLEVMGLSGVIDEVEALEAGGAERHVNRAAIDREEGGEAGRGLLEAADVEVGEWVLDCFAEELFRVVVGGGSLENI